ncbi:ABC-2 family transporter protein [Pseudomonas sp. NFACC13-1]|uniref:ABC-2 family transporter protein n=1 Tax=Pseudomonas sp. NFACC13-1 TaxID=1566245 RepID=UPI00088B3545|nr:ABC-2 family transporter protein [Pseudomonas sp. NFACC13-1]SDB20368.1 ABC-2 type transport system permease protein [Pseudomonas sp. NFACC13-1]
MNITAYYKLIQTGLLSAYRDRSMLITDLLIATGVPFFIQFAIWSFVYHGGTAETLPQYTLKETYLYYVSVLALNRLNNTYDLIFRVSTNVHEGQLEGIFIKPISYFKYNLFIFLGESILYYVPILIIAAFVMISGSIGPGVIGFIILSLINLLFCFLLGFLMSLSTFWLTRPDMTLSFQAILANVIGGTLLPLSYWPEFLQPLMRYNPFRLLISGPAEFLLRPSSELLIELLSLYAAWFLIMLAACKIAFKFASNRYSGVGG